MLLIASAAIAGGPPVDPKADHPWGGDQQVSVQAADHPWGGDQILISLDFWLTLLTVI